MHGKTVKNIYIHNIFETPDKFRNFKYIRFYSIHVSLIKIIIFVVKNFPKNIEYFSSPVCEY
jgi:hypothetical protein